MPDRREDTSAMAAQPSPLPPHSLLGGSSAASTSGGASLPASSPSDRLRTAAPSSNRAFVLSWPQSVVDQMVDRTSAPTERMTQLCGKARVVVFVIYLKLSHRTTAVTAGGSEGCFYYPLYVMPMFPIDSPFAPASHPA